MNRPALTRRVALTLLFILACVTAAFAGSDRPSNTSDETPSQTISGSQSPTGEFVSNLDDGVIDIEVLRDGTVRYELDVMYGAFNVYRGEIETMLSAGIYTQDMSGIPGAHRWCDGTTGALMDWFTPPVGRIAFYVATGTQPGGESKPGHTSAQVVRPHHNPCHPCQASFQCATGQYCSKPLDSCRFANYGVCAPKPQACPTVWEPVCGCSANTYGNACEAAVASQNVRRLGECHLECQANDECAASEYCDKDPGMCSVTGLCRTRPTACTADIATVCGCDAGSYDNGCEAARAGASVAYDGLCNCTTSAECHPAQYCSTSDCGAGQCFTRPTECSSVPDPVCGCDGRTYLNECAARMAGVSVRPGECVAECTSNAQCSATDYCVKSCDAADVGYCARRAPGCNYVWMPVCGCDGLTYSNGCWSSAHGVNIAHVGECGGCFTSADCSSTEYCGWDPQDVHRCIGTGTCANRPVACPDVESPVCSCDGTTYKNACEANRAGASVRGLGACTP